MAKILLFVFLFISPLVQALEDPGPEPNPLLDTLPTDSSEYHRVDKTFMADAQLIGVGPSYVPTLGLQAGYFIHRNMVVFFEYTGGKMSGSPYEDENAEGSYDLKARSWGIHLKHFLGNSFYYRAGYDFRTYDYKVEGLGFISTFKGKSSGPTVAIGNMWQWSFFNLGVDWIGVTIPLASSFSNESFNSFADYDLAMYNDHKDILVEKPTWNLLRLYLGYAF